jgi:hypothetical protein
MASDSTVQLPAGRMTCSKVGYKTKMYLWAAWDRTGMLLTHHSPQVGRHRVEAAVGDP